MDDNLRSRWATRYAIGLTETGCSLLLDPTGASVAESFYVAGALDTLTRLARTCEDPANLLDLAGDLYDEAEKRLATLDATRVPRVIGGPNE